MQGLITEWRGPSGLQVVAGGGVPGLYDGIEVPDFRTLGGSTATAGAQWSPASHWTVGGQLIEAHDVNLAIGPAIDGAALLSSTTGLLTAAWADHGEHLQFNLLDGDVNSKGNAVGAWVDGSIVHGRVQQNAGIFRIDPNMTWGNQVISDDMQGAYYRLDYQSRQWLADVGIDEVHSVSGLGTNTTFLTGDTRYQLSRDWGIGSVANISRTDGGTAWSVEGYLDHLNAWGTGRTQADFAKTQTSQDVTLTLNQTWSTPVGMRLSTSTSVENISGAIVNGLQQDSTILGLAAFGGGHFTTKLGVDGNVNWMGAVRGRAAPGVSANVSLTYQISRHWEILATYYDSRTGSWTPPTVLSPLTPPVEMPVPALEERGVFLTIRYQRAAGSHFAPLGGAAGAGSGEIAGIVYLDANNNGHLDAGETGAPNVTVVLDGRFSVQTDARGRFNFPTVATGHHFITVIPDNLPLPWTLVNEGRAEVEVMTRDRSDIGIAAQRPR
jgi:SdrD B-like domain